ncbi:thiolase [Fomitiporia mediterranea MF3/22]|uniref:thiolase n=1 Tax=Fomitiporia mediterranea (strain MF3/22) TaxID=694068 RepID=UPI0004408CAC|nr:thiolase [Fomitiporia mediterranea MF3/22]EJD03714.1 thiolase [Fomitiporia mediterranea MF3/22]
MERVKSFASHFTGNSGRASLERKSPDDVVITLAVRSPMCKARKGGFKDTRSDELLTALYKAAIARAGIDPKLIEDICVGNVLTPRPTFEARAAALAAGIPETTPVQVINRFCSSGLMAVTTISNQIRAGQIEIGLAIGSESMSANPDQGSPPLSEEIMTHPVAKDCVGPMGWTSENVAKDFNISREDMDALAALSFQRAESAQKAGIFASEIVPLTVPKHDPDTGKTEQITVDHDDGIRYGTTKETLLKLRSAFPQWGDGKTTGGNASQITDGAAAVLLMTRRKAEQLGLKIIAKHVTTAVAGLAPRIMGIGPTFAIPEALKKAGITIDDVDLFEINEAFASMYVYCVRKLNLDIEKVNVNGGAIALGHPLGCTGARQVATGLNALARRNGKILVTSMCIGTGMGAAAVFVRD